MGPNSKHHSSVGSYDVGFEDDGLVNDNDCSAKFGPIRFGVEALRFGENLAATEFAKVRLEPYKLSGLGVRRTQLLPASRVALSLPPSACRSCRRPEFRVYRGLGLPRDSNIP